MKEGICLRCNKKFIYKPSNNTGKYCSFNCYSKHCVGENNNNFKDSGKQICLKCSQQFKSYDSRRKYCSSKCYFYRNYEEFICEQCGEKFQRNKNKVNRFCSGFCSRKWQSETSAESRIKKNCPVCFKEFEVTRAWRKKICCSLECSWKRMKKTTKGEGNHRYIDGRSKSRNRGDNWIEQRNKAFDRDAGCCQLCGFEEGLLDVHHIIPYRVSKNNSLNNLITLCKHCHPREDNFYRQFKKPSKKVLDFQIKIINLEVERGIK